MSRVVGVDGARGRGWIVVRLADDRLASIDFHLELGDALEEHDDAEVLAVDIPVGHEADRDDGHREADVAASEFLGPRSSSIFYHCPPRVMNASSYDEARDLADHEEWKRPQSQIWQLRHRIAEAEELARVDDRIYEVHPEVSFLALHRALGHDGYLDSSKKDGEGFFHRLQLLHDADLRPTRSIGGLGRASPDDVLDATVCAWSAARIARGEGQTLPEEPPKDPRTGRPVAIWY